MTRGRLLTAIVLIHLAVSIVHGRAHAGAHVPVSAIDGLFIYAVILAAPLIGLGISRWRPRFGGWTVSASMAGALVFGLINHFIVDGPDHIARVAAPWRQLFGVTAVLLVACEAAGAAAGVWFAAAVHDAAKRTS